MEAKDNAVTSGMEKATMVGGARTKPANHVPTQKEGAPMMSSLTYSTEKASDHLVYHNANEVSENVPKADMRDIAQHMQNKPSPKLQPKVANNQNMHINQPL